MSKSRQELKVGIFVLICLILLGGPADAIQQGLHAFSCPTYTIILNAANVGGLRPRASVLMSGVQIGTRR